MGKDLGRREGRKAGHANLMLRVKVGHPFETAIDKLIDPFRKVEQRCDKALAWATKHRLNCTGTHGSVTTVRQLVNQLSELIPRHRGQVPVWFMRETIGCGLDSAFARAGETAPGEATAPGHTTGTHEWQ